MDCRDGANCNNLQISVVNTSIVSITCTGSTTDYGCTLGQIDASNASELYIYAGYNGIYGTDIYGQNISSTFEITAIGNGSSYPGITGGAEIWIPALDADLNVFSLNCYASGCYEMYFIKENGFDNIANANLNFNGCFQCIDDSMFWFISFVALLFVSHYVLSSITIWNNTTPKQ